MVIKYIEGDLFSAIDKDADVQTTLIPHCCNNRGGWGSGFVLPLARRFPKARHAYLNWFSEDTITENTSVKYFKLGETQFVDVQESPRIFVCNMIGQNGFGHNNQRFLKYNSISRCMDQVAAHAIEHQAKIVAPLFGSGLAGGNWLFIEELIEDCWISKNIPVTIYYLNSHLPQNWSPPSEDKGAG